jgi:hypothetical protein
MFVASILKAYGGKGKQGAKKASKLRAEWEKNIVKNGYIMN